MPFASQGMETGELLVNFRFVKVKTKINVENFHIRNFVNESVFSPNYCHKILEILYCVTVLCSCMTD